MYDKIRDFVVPSGANYTEFLRDYLVNNNLPDTLSDADEVFEIDFKDTFKNFYYMREIGFDTEELFTHYLNIEINIKLPYYIDKAQKLKTLFNQTFESGYTITQTNNLYLNINDSNSITRKGYKTPLGSDGTLPASAISDGETVADTKQNTQANTGTVTTVYSKNPKFNSLDTIKAMQEEFQNIIEETLLAFDKLFMQVY